MTKKMQYSGRAKCAYTSSTHSLFLLSIQFSPTLPVYTYTHVICRRIYFFKLFIQVKLECAWQTFFKLAENYGLLVLPLHFQYIFFYIHRNEWIFSLKYARECVSECNVYILENWNVDCGGAGDGWKLLIVNCDVAVVEIGTYL